MPHSHSEHAPGHPQHVPHSLHMRANRPAHRRSTLLTRWAQDTAENSRQTGARVGKRLGPVGPPPSPHPKSRHMWLTLTGLAESNQPFAERHSLNDNANHLLHYLACASVRKRKEPSSLIKCENFCSSHLPSAFTDSS